MTMGQLGGKGGRQGPKYLPGVGELVGELSSDPDCTTVWPCEDITPPLRLFSYQ